MRMKWNWRQIIIIVIFFWLWFYLPLFAGAGAEPEPKPEPPAISMSIRPRAMMMGQYVRVTVRVPQHPNNRRLRLYWGVEAEGIYSSSDVQLDGDSQSTRMTYWFLRELSASGRWKFTAELLRNDETIKIAVEYVEVRGMDDIGGW